MHTMFKKVFTNISIFRSYDVYLLFSDNFENIFPDLSPKWQNGPSSVKTTSTKKIRKTQLGKVTKFQTATPNGLGVIKNNPGGGL